MDTYIKFFTSPVAANLFGQIFEVLKKFSGLITKAGEKFIHLFQTGGEHFVSLVVGIIPTLIVLMTFVNAITKMVGEDRVNRFAEKISKYKIFRYTLLPLIGVIFLTNPMCFSFGKFLDEKYKPAYYDACVSFVHPVLGLFPHANGSEIVIYNGVLQGIIALGLSQANLAVRYFFTGIVIMLLRGVVTEKITAIMMKKKGIEEIPNSKEEIAGEEVVNV